VRIALAVIAAAALLAAAAGCSGEDEKASASPVSAAAFKDRVASSIVTGTELQAEPGFGLKVDVSANDSLNTLSLRLDEDFATYRAQPERRDGIVSRLVQEAKTRMAQGNSAESFASARSLVLPVLKPKLAFRKLSTHATTTAFPGRLLIAYAVQRPDSFMVLSDADIARWKRPLAEIHSLALANLVRQTNRKQPLRCEQRLCGWASADGYDAARMVVPELRRQIVRKIGPAVYAAPRESVFVALPIRLADRIRGKVVRDFVTAPNPVSPDVFVERRGELVVLPE
jgi:uncharacterized protein YtpQ (UPF0354 family)